MTKFSHERKHVRVTTDFTAIAKPYQKAQFEGKVLNLSEGGAFLATKEPLSVGSEVVLFLTLEVPGKRNSSIAQGKVVWANGNKERGDVGCGIAFEGVSSSLRGFIREFVEFKQSGKVGAMGVAQDVKGLRAKGRGQLRG